MYVFFQLIILHPHPHLPVTSAKQIRKTIRILHVWKSASPQIHILPEALRHNSSLIDVDITRQQHRPEQGLD